MAGGAIENGCRRLLQRKDAGELDDAVLSLGALGIDEAAARAHQVAQRRAAQIEDDVPARADDVAPESQPMQRQRPLFDDDQPVEAGNRLEERRRHRPGGDGEARLRKALDQVSEHPGR